MAPWTSAMVGSRKRTRGSAAQVETKESVPKSATQLRNARKRASKKRKHQETAVQDPSLKFIHHPLSTPLIHSAKRFFRERGSIKSLPIRLGPTECWRTEAKLAVRAGPHGLDIGLFAPGTHDICRVDGCPAHHPAINQGVAVVEQACNAVGLRGYDEKTGQGDLRYLKFDVHRPTEKIQLTLVWHADSQEVAGAPLKSLLKKLSESTLWYSVWANFHPASKHVSRILNYDTDAWVHLLGSRKMLREQLLQCALPYAAPRLCFPPFVFRQANLSAFEEIVVSIRRFIVPQSRVVELYGGVGTIGLHLADLVSSLQCSDENPHNMRCFNRSARGLPVELRDRLSYESGDAAAQVASLRRADVVIVDPPRKGLDETVLSALERPARCLQRLIYVSCGFPAFQRDADRLLGAGWSVLHAEGFVLFPGADHLETFCVFDRQTSA